MRILILGRNKAGSLESFYVSNLNLHTNVEVKVYACHDEFYRYYFKSYQNKLLYRLGFRGILYTINEHVLVQVEQFKPDFVLVFKGMEIFPSTLIRLKEKGIKLINYNPDHPFHFFGRGSGNKLVSNSIELYDLYISYSSAICESLQNRYNVRAEIIPFGYQYTVDKPVKEGEEINKLCFVGTADKERVKLIRFLSENGIEIDVYGNGWNRFLKKFSKCKLHDPVIDKTFVKITSSYRVSLNMLRPQNFGSHNMRTFEVPALGSIMVSPYTEEQNFYFEDFNEVFFYKSDLELLTILRMISKMTLEEATRIKVNALNRSHNSRYSYLDRVDEMLKLIENV